MKNKKIKFGTFFALFTNVAIVSSCMLSTQLTSNKNIQSLLLNESYTWNEDTNNLIYWADKREQISGTIGVELYKNNEHKGIKIANGSTAKIRNASITETLHTEYDGDVRIETVGSRAFEGNKSIDGQLNIMDVVNIEDHAFSKTNLERVVISSGTKYINEYAFCDCIDLKQIIVGHATNDIPLIREGAFANCPNIQQIDIYQFVRPSIYLEKWELVAEIISQQVGHEVSLIWH